MWKWLCGAAMALGVVTVATSAQASTFHIDFFQDADAIPDWFGTFEAPLAGGTLTAFSALIAGQTYNTPFSGFGNYDSALNQISPSEYTVNPGIPPAANNLAVLLSTGHVWSLGSCDTFGGVHICFGGSGGGTYSITPSPVPLPAALPLFVVGDLGLAAFRRLTKSADNLNS